MLSTIVWLQLSQETRKKIATELGVPRSSGFDVQGGRVVSDGYTPNDLASITIEKLQTATGLDKTDFYALFNAYVLQLEQGEVVNTVISEPKLEETKTETKPADSETLFPVEKPNALYAQPKAKKSK